LSKDNQAGVAAVREVIYVVLFGQNISHHTPGQYFFQYGRVRDPITLFQTLPNPSFNAYLQSDVPHCGYPTIFELFFWVKLVVPRSRANEPLL